MGAPSGSESQFGARYAKGLTTHGEAIWVPPVNEFVRIISMEGMEAQYTFTPVDHMDPSNQTTGGAPTVGAVTPKVKINPDVNSIVPYLVHQCGKDPAITTPAGGTDSRQFVITPYENGDTAPASFIDSLILEGFDGQETTLVENARLQDLGIKIDQGKNVIADLGFVACSDTREADAVTVLAATYTGKPIIKGQRSAAIAASLLKLKCTAVAGGGFNGTIKATIGAYAGATVMQILFDKWYRLILDDGAMGGVSREQDLWFMYPSSGATVLAVNDEHTFAATRTKAVASYSPRSILRAGGFELTVGGSEYFVKSGELKITRPWKQNYVAGRMFALGIQKNGKWKVELSLDRDRDDTEFVNRLRRNETFAVRVNMYGLPIEGNILERWQVDLNCKVSGVTRGVSNENALGEKITIMGERSGSTDIVTHTVVCSRLAA